MNSDFGRNFWLGRESCPFPIASQKVGYRFPYFIDLLQEGNFYLGWIIKIVYSGR